MPFSVSTATISAITDKVIPELCSGSMPAGEGLFPSGWTPFNYKSPGGWSLPEQGHYTVLALNLEGKKEFCPYLSESEGANFWLSVPVDLQNRELKTF